MSATSLSRFSKGLTRHAIITRRFQSTESNLSSAVEQVINPPRQKVPGERFFKPRPAITHYLALQLDNGSFFDGLKQLRSFLRNSGAPAGLHPEMVMPNLARTCLFRFGSINIEGYKSNTSPLQDQPSFSLSQVEEALEKARTRIDEKIDKNALELNWGFISPLLPFNKPGNEKSVFNPGLVKILHLRTQMNPAWDNIKIMQNIVFEELESAGVTNARMREKPGIHLTIANTKWKDSIVNGEQQKPKPFNIKTLYTTPGFDQFRSVPLPTKDEALSRFTPINLGQCRVTNFVLEEIGQNIQQIDSDPIFTKSYEFA